MPWYFGGSVAIDRSGRLDVAVLTTDLSALDLGYRGGVWGAPIPF